MKQIKKFFRKIQQRMLTARIKRETHERIIPHLRGDARYDYRFNTPEELAASNAEDLQATLRTLRLLERAAGKMSEAEGHAFRHIVHRDIQNRLWQCIESTSESMLPARPRKVDPAVQPVT